MSLSASDLPLERQCCSQLLHPSWDLRADVRRMLPLTRGKDRGGARTAAGLALFGFANLGGKLLKSQGLVLQGLSWQKALA